MRRLFLILFLLLPLLASGCMDTRQLSGAEIRALLTNARVEGKHRERTFKQVSPDGAEAAWSTSGQRVCVHWKTGNRGNLCRTVLTNDRGDYWKVLHKRKGGTKTVVTYSRITDLETGADRMVKGSLPVIVMRIVFSPPGWGLVLGLLFLYALWRSKQPTPIKVGDRSYLPEELQALPIAEVDAIFKELLVAMHYGDARRVFEIMRLQSGSLTPAWARIWKPISALSDADAYNVLGRILQAENPEIFPKSLLDMVKDDPRAVYLIGRGYSLWAEDVRRTHDAAAFSKAREGGMLFLDYLREDSGAPVPDPSKEAEDAASVGAPVADGVSLQDPSQAGEGSDPKIVITKEDLSGDYVAMAAGAYETVMYLQHDPPAYVASGSSGGGG